MREKRKFVTNDLNDASSVPMCSMECSCYNREVSSIEDYRMKIKSYGETLYLLNGILSSAYLAAKVLLALVYYPKDQEAFPFSLFA